MKYLNGNADITIQQNGTRIIEFDGQLNLDWPLNIDIRVSNRCSFGYNPSTNSAFCSFCHESARTDGSECDYWALKTQLVDLPPGIELAIGGNQLTEELAHFLGWCKGKGFICNLTVNQGHLRRDKTILKWCIDHLWVNGLGISYRPELKWDIPSDFLKYENTVFHVIAGIDSFSDVLNLSTKGVKKVLVLGEKDFGFNQGNVDLKSQSHKEWFWWIRKLFDAFDVVSFDNLALEQLNVQRFIPKDNWSTFYQGEHSFYINAVEGYFSPSSRNPNKTDWNLTDIKSYFKTII